MRSASSSDLLMSTATPEHAPSSTCFTWSGGRFIAAARLRGEGLVEGPSPSPPSRVHAGPSADSAPEPTPSSEVVPTDVRVRHPPPVHRRDPADRDEPGDVRPVLRRRRSTRGATPAARTARRRRSSRPNKALGYDKPVIVQWTDFLKGVVAGREYPDDPELRAAAPELVTRLPGAVPGLLGRQRHRPSTT